MNDVRQRLDDAEKETRAEIDRLNEVLKYILLARSHYDAEELQEKHPDLTETPALAPAPLPLGGPKRQAIESELGKQAKTRYKRLTLRTAITDVLARVGKPIDSVEVHRRLKAGGWTSTSKDSLLLVRQALSKLRHDIRTEKIDGAWHYSQKPLEELM